MRVKKASGKNRLLAGLLALVMFVGLLPANVFATEDKELTAALEEAKAYTDALTINNSSNDPETVVKNYGTHFTWDNEDRENGKTYLYDWSYYNGVVFEGLEYLYEVTGEKAYKDYVVEYMSSLIASNGTWAKCSNNSSKECAGYNATHGADCYKTASLLLDTYEMTNDSRYLTIAAALYADLDTAAANKTYSLKNAGNNFRHTWASDSTPDLWLDGLYMILPFRAEYAKYTKDTAELDLIVSRMQWVSDNMYNSSKKLFYHAADSATSNSGTYWLRAIGWYAAAIVDIMDSMEGQNLETMKAQLVKLVDGMKACQNASNGMWLNNMDASQSSTNPYETSGTALVCYAVMKAVNNGWLDASYADMAIKAFKGICNEKLNGTTLKDICFKGAPGSGNSTFYDNEGKGVGPFIMLYAEVQEYVNKLNEEPEVPEVPEISEKTFESKDTFAAVTATASGAELTAIVDNAAADELLSDWYGYDISLTEQVEGTDVTITFWLPPEAMSSENLAVYRLNETTGTFEPVTGYAVGVDAEEVEYITISDAALGTYIYGTPSVKIGENAVLTALEITSAPDTTKYFVTQTNEDGILPLDITGLVVQATYSDGTVDTVKEIPWNEFGEIEDGYSLSADMSEVGEKDVVVSYTYGDVTLTDTFAITIYGKTLEAENKTGVSIELTVPGVTEIEVTENTEDETVKAALTGKVKEYVSYDIDLTGYEQGDEVTVTLPVPAGWDTTSLIGVSIEGDEVKLIPGHYSKVANTFSFVTNHFSTKGVALAAESTGTGTLPGGTQYVLDTDGVDAGGVYLIVNSNTEKGQALRYKPNDGKREKQDVKITDSGTNKVIDTGFTNEEYSKWTFSQDDDGWYISSGTRKLRLNNGEILNDEGQALTVTHQGNGAYQIEAEVQGTGSNWWRTYIYYLRYGTNWERSTTESYVYLYKLTEISGGEVKFEVAPGSVNIAPAGTTSLTGKVTVAGETVDLSKYTITWKSSDDSIATVTNGTVTGVADGTAKITATLSAVDGTALQSPIVLNIPVTVQSKSIVSGTEVLSGNDPITTKLNVEPDFSNIKLIVTYDDGTTGKITVANGLKIEGYDITTVGFGYATISYNDEQYGTVLVTVEGNPYAGLEEATTYPEYPADGSVRIDKTATEKEFATTGVVEVELDVAGVSVKSAVDVILVTDLSNSMAWKAGGRTDATSHEDTKVYDLAQSVSSFADIFLAPDAAGNPTVNTMSLVTFGGYDADHTKKVYTAYADPTQTLLLGTKDAAAVKNTISNIRVLRESVLGRDSSTDYYLSFDGGNTYGENYGNTNYDHAFMQTADAIKALKDAYKQQNDKEYDESGRQIYILFMTDGAPSNYDGVYYNYKTGDRADVNCTWINEKGEKVTYTMGNNRAQYNAADWFKYIAGGTYNATTGTVPGNPLYWADQVYNTKGVADIYNIAFDIDNGGFSSMTFTANDGRPLAKVLEKLVTGKTLEVFGADDEAGLTEIYSKLAHKIRFAGTSAQVSDTIDSDFTLQMASYSGTGKLQVELADEIEITVKTYDLWTKDETKDATLIGTRKTNDDGTYVSSAIETVSFNPAGTEAYSDKINNSSTNIMTTDSAGNVTIKAQCFTYTKVGGVEKFEWKIGNITDKEIALSYYAYLKGSLEGEKPQGLVYTNEEATLDYIDLNGDHATKVFPIPAVAWGGASTSYEFYLVNNAGEPCDRDGNKIPFANRVIITGPFFEELYLNQEGEEIAEEIVAAHVLPAGYTLYDDTAKYTVVTASGENEGALTISTPATGKAQTTILVSATERTFIQSRVAFGVIYNKIPTEAAFELIPERVVIDYGKPILIDVWTTDRVESGYTATLIGFSKYYDSVDLKNKFTNTSAMDDFKATYGTFSIEDAANGIVKYTPTKMVNGVEMVFAVFKMYNANAHDTYYMVDWVTVIPATTVYYETDFATGVFDLTTTSGAWETKTDGTSADGPQDDGTIGVNQTYGYDSTYTNDRLLSNGSSLFVIGQGVKLNDKTANYTEAKFSFTGTGFDIISRTGAAQGAIRVNIFKDEARTNLKKSVTVLNKSESNLELYQIPVVSVNDLDYGTYYVTIGVNAAYTNASYPALNRGGEFYFDALRVFDPVKGNEVAEAAYEADGEYDPQRTEVRQMLISAGDFEAIGNISVDGMVFIDRTQNSADVTTYTTIGPNNEVYLSEDQAIAFKVTARSYRPLTSLDIGAKAITGDAAILNAIVADSAGQTLKKVDDITSSTAQNYDLLDAAVSGAMDDGTAYVIISNTGSGVLSITDLKAAFGPEPALMMLRSRMVSDVAPAEEEVAESVVTYSVDAATFALARTVLMTVEEEVPEEIPPVETPEDPETEETPEAEKPKPGKPGKPDEEKPKPGKPDKSDEEKPKPGKPEKPEKEKPKPGKPEKPAEPEKPSKPDKNDKPSKPEPNKGNGNDKHNAGKGNKK